MSSPKAKSFLIPNSHKQKPLRLDEDRLSRLRQSPYERTPPLNKKHKNHGTGSVSNVSGQVQGFSLPDNYGVTSSTYSPLTAAFKRNRSPRDHNANSNKLDNGFSFNNSTGTSNHNSTSLLDGLYFHQNISDVDNLLESNYDFEDSHPSSSDADSSDSSLDDVCLPINPDSNSTVKNWPDLSVLQEFYDEEMREAMAIAEASKRHAPFSSDGYSTADEHSTNSAQAVGFHYPLVSKVDTPTPAATLTTKKINETEAIKGRLRPPRFSPWDKSVRANLKKYLPNELQSTNNLSSRVANDAAAAAVANPQGDTVATGLGAGEPEKKFEQFRYTYFRPSLDSTIHSPSISGLLQDGQTFADLFVVSQYQKAKMPPSIIKQKSRLNVPDSNTSNTSSGPNNVTTNTASKDGTATPRSIGPLATASNNISNSNFATPPPEDPVPFWLDVLDPTEEEIKVLSKAFGIHPLTTEDIFLNEAREKVELFKDYYFVCFRSFDIVQERLKRKALNEKLSNLEQFNFEEIKKSNSKLARLKRTLGSIFARRRRGGSGDDVGDYHSLENGNFGREYQQKKNKVRRQGSKYRELEPLNFYIIVFHEGVITFHFSPTPHPVTVRRRARLLKDYLTVSSDWIAYALIDDITDAFGPMIETIEEEVYSFEDAILKLHSGSTSDSDDSDSDTDTVYYNSDAKTVSSNVSSSSSSSSYLSTSSAEWQRKGDMLRRIGECRKRIMSLLRLLGSKADVIKGLAKRCNENFDVAPRSEIGMYLGDIQDHIITMVQSLNHYEKLLARSHSNYLAQINIDMTKVNNDMNDVLGKITILGTVVLPMNIITGLWGMNVIVPGQDAEGLKWFFSILLSMIMIAIASYFITVKVYNF